MTLRDGSGRVRKLWGGYSPKVYDSHFMSLKRRWFKRKLAGTGILADMHFFEARAHIKDPDILATAPPKITADLLRVRGYAEDTREAKRKSAAITKKRGVVEQIYARVKKIFLPLAGGPYHVWREPESELDYVVEWACGVHNRLIDKRDN